MSRYIVQDTAVFVCVRAHIQTVVVVVHTRTEPRFPSHHAALTLVASGVWELSVADHPALARQL